MTGEKVNWLVFYGESHLWFTWIWKLAQHTTLLIIIESNNVEPVIVLSVIVIGFVVVSMGDFSKNKNWCINGQNIYFSKQYSYHVR